MLLAQITDLHMRPKGKVLNGQVDSHLALRRTVDRLFGLDPRPDAILVTGDLTDGGLEEEYRLVRAELDRLPMPVYPIPGNHDDREAMRAAFADLPCLAGSSGFIQYALPLGPLRLIALDTLVAGQPHGELCQERLDWLEAQLAEARDRPTIVMMHHPPVPLGFAAMDRMNCRGAEALAPLVARHPEIERIFCGHVHRAAHVRWQGTVVSTAPSIGVQQALDLRPGAPLSLSLEPPAFHLHQWLPGLGLVTHEAFIDDFPGPLPAGD